MINHRFFVIGYYGYQNYGDEWIRHKTSQWIHHYYPNSTTTFLTAKRSSDPKDIYRWSPIAIIKACFQCNTIVFGGGSLLQNSTSNRSLLYYLLFILLGLIFKKKLLFLAQGIGPIHGRFFTWLVTKCSQRIHYGFVRDSYSLSWFKNHKSISKKHDLAFFKESFSSTDQLRSAGIGLVLKNDPQLHPIISAIYAAISAFPSKGYVFNPSDTYAYSLLNTKMTIHKMIFNSKQPSTFSSSTACLISMRYHACILAIIHQLPFLCISRDPKLIHLAQEFNQPFIDLNQPNSISTITTLCSDFYNQRHSYQKAIQTQISSISSDWSTEL